MKISEVSNADLENAKQMQEILRGAKLELPVTQMAVVARVLDWYRGLCIELGKGYQSAVKPPADAPTQGLTVKDFHPGVLPAPAKVKSKGKK